ncbi:hypothetical protein [Streptomyces candidus]|uniref:Uncharacterized protein n=1 Tax=Streptomyces candidus TaxID=67283 RepID=A0A7X0HE85_9ACTN|nr:hypothetical protein [Streptomyces candidus]MBB6435985.1 hypothetical protein [Streptomyces candidus]GHH43231.1 hypothetical protein GCM10018773_28890 [Streptomyces candidus]
MKRSRRRSPLRLGLAALFALLLTLLATPSTSAAPAVRADAGSVVASFDVTAHTRWGQQVEVPSGRTARHFPCSDPDRE